MKQIKEKIQESLETMSETQLESAWLILKELTYQEHFENPEVDKELLDSKICTGIQQLENKEGIDFRQFLNEVQEDYGVKK